MPKKLAAILDKWNITLYIHSNKIKGEKIDTKIFS